MNNTSKTILLVAVVALVVSFIGAKIFSPTSDQGQDLLAEVLNRGEIRVGYVVYPPGMIKDPNTGELSGIFHDALEEAGKNLGLEINWVEEVGWGTMIEGLNAGRYDMIGSPVWPNSSRAKNVDFTIPLNYSAVGVYTRTGDNRFSDLNNINRSDITIATIDGEMSSFIAQATFPDAETISLPQDTQVSQLLLNLTTRKADVTFVETAIAEEFLANNPGSIQNIVPNDPIRSFGNTMLVPKNREAFKSTINAALEELMNSGTVDSLIDKYEKYPGSFYRVAPPYSAPR
jgi:polar amino acid transport system substrate-binding protein